MVGRLYKSVRCWKYRDSPIPHPVIKCVLFNLRGEQMGPVDIPIDTGFSGSLLVPQMVFEHFKMAELPPRYRRTYSTMTGELVMRVARGFMLVDSVEMEVFVETPLFGAGKLLVGREVLNKLTLTLDGSRRECCLSLLSSEASPSMR